MCLFIGKINCLIFVADKIVNFTTIPLANYVYSKTLYVMPSCFTLFVIAGAIGELLAYAFITEDEISEEQYALQNEKSEIL